MMSTFPIKIVNIFISYFKFLFLIILTYLSYLTLVLMFVCLYRLFFFSCLLVSPVIFCWMSDVTSGSRNQDKEDISVRFYVNLGTSWAMFNVCCSHGYWSLKSNNILVLVSYVYFRLPKSFSSERVCLLALSVIIHWIAEPLLVWW